jgi:inner membrane protein
VPTIISHAVVPLAIGIGLGRARLPTGLLVAGMLCAMLPDADVVAFVVGIPYADSFGHRGASHSLPAAVLVGLLAFAVCHRIAAPPVLAALFLAMSTASHGLLDMFTDGGLGVALYWPVSDVRISAPVRPIEVSPIGRDFLSMRGLAVLASEIVWVWLPCVLLACALRFGLPAQVPAWRT